MKIKGKIDEIGITRGMGKKGEWTRWAFKIDGKTYSTFDEKIGNKFKVGEVVEMQTQRDKTDTYDNMLTMELATGEPTINEHQIKVGFEVEDLLRQILAELKSNKVEV